MPAYMDRLIMVLQMKECYKVPLFKERYLMSYFCGSNSSTTSGCSIIITTSIKFNIVIDGKGTFAPTEGYK